MRENFTKNAIIEEQEAPKEDDEEAKSKQDDKPLEINDENEKKEEQ